MEPLKTMGFSGTRYAGEPRDSRDNHSMMGFGKRMSRTGRALMAAVALGALGAGVAMANPVAPSLKPSPTLSSTWLETSDFTLLNRALDAADDGQWTQVRSYLDRIGDPAAQALIRWRIATNGDTGMGYSDLIKAQ